MAISKDTIDRLNDPTIEVTRSVFMDRHGNWAKQWEDVRDVYVDFSDDTTVVIEPTDFRQLTREQQRKIREAPSSPLPADPTP